MEMRPDRVARGPIHYKDGALRNELLNALSNGVVKAGACT